MSTLIKNGTIITASETFIDDILVEGERISRIGLDLEADADHVIDARGKLIMPGGVDPHTLRPAYVRHSLLRRPLHRSQSGGVWWHDNCHRLCCARAAGFQAFC